MRSAFAPWTNISSPTPAPLLSRPSARLMQSTLPRPSTSTQSTRSSPTTCARRPRLVSPASARLPPAPEENYATAGKSAVGKYCCQAAGMLGLATWMKTFGPGAFGVFLGCMWISRGSRLPLRRLEDAPGAAAFFPTPFSPPRRGGAGGGGGAGFWGPPDWAGPGGGGGGRARGGG